MFTVKSVSQPCAITIVDRVLLYQRPNNVKHVKLASLCIPTVQNKNKISILCHWHLMVKISLLLMKILFVCGIQIGLYLHLVFVCLLVLEQLLVKKCLKISLLAQKEQHKKMRLFQKPASIQHHKTAFFFTLHVLATSMFVTSEKNLIFSLHQASNLAHRLLT